MAAAPGVDKQSTSSVRQLQCCLSGPGDPAGGCDASIARMGDNTVAEDRIWFSARARGPMAVTEAMR